MLAPANTIRHRDGSHENSFFKRIPQRQNLCHEPLRHLRVQARQSPLWEGHAGNRHVKLRGSQQFSRMGRGRYSLRRILGNSRSNSSSSPSATQIPLQTSTFQPVNGTNGAANESDQKIRCEASSFHPSEWDSAVQVVKQARCYWSGGGSQHRGEGDCTDSFCRSLQTGASCGAVNSSDRRR